MTFPTRLRQKQARSPKLWVQLLNFLTMEKNKLRQKNSPILSINTITLPLPFPHLNCKLPLKQRKLTSSVLHRSKKEKKKKWECQLSTKRGNHQFLQVGCSRPWSLKLMKAYQNSSHKLSRLLRFKETPKRLSSPKVNIYVRSISNSCMQSARIRISLIKYFFPMKNRFWIEPFEAQDWFSGHWETFMQIYSDRRRVSGIGWESWIYFLLGEIWAIGKWRKCCEEQHWVPYQRWC